MPSINNSSVNSQADNLATDYATATLTIFAGTPPATINAALSSNPVLATHTLAGFGAAGAVSVGRVDANAIADETIANTGAPTFARLVLSTKSMQITAGTGAGNELVTSSDSYVAGEDSAITSLRLTQPVS